MSDSRNWTGDFVHYTHLGESGIGKVKAGGDGPLVEFWSGKVERKRASDLSPVEDPGPVSMLWGKSTELEPWAREKPLKLVALALSIDDGRGSANSVKEKLEYLAPLKRDWKTWWSQRAKSLNAFSALPEPQHFVKSGKGNEYTLLCSIEDVPDDARPPVSLDDWKGWLSSDANLPTIGKNPSKVFCDSLAEWPADTIESAVKRVLWGAELLLASPKKPSAAAALAWMDAVGSAALRWSALYPDSLEMTERSGDVLSRLSQHIQVKEKRKEATLFRAGILAEGPDRQRQLAQQRREQERQRTEYENRLEQQRQELERQRTDYEERLERQRQEQERQCASYEAVLKELQEAHEAELEEEQREQDRLQQKLRSFDALMKSGRKESSLEIRRPMLLAVGDALQRAYIQGKSSEDRLINVILTLSKALQEGEAETLGTVGATANYDPMLHHSPEKIPSGVKVRLKAPGVKVGEQVILKASVSTETEVW